MIEKTFESFPAPFVGTVGFFISPEGVLSEIQGGSHIATVIRNPSKFGLTREEIEEAHRVCGEHLGTEGKARVKILSRVIEAGWIRVRRYRKTGWSVTVRVLDPQTVARLRDWAGQILVGYGGYREADPFNVVVITATDGSVVSSTVKELAEGLVRADSSVASDGSERRCLPNTAREAGTQKIPDLSGLVSNGVRILRTPKRSTFEDVKVRCVWSEDDFPKIWTNPRKADFGELPDVVRFTAVLALREIHLWEYSRAFHTDISNCLKLGDAYDSLGFLKGAAMRRTNGRFVMFQSHYLEAFKKGRLTGKERATLLNLLGQDWSWVSEYVEVSSWLDSYRRGLGL